MKKILAHSYQPGTGQDSDRVRCTVCRIPLRKFEQRDGLCRQCLRYHRVGQHVEAAMRLLKQTHEFKR